MLPSLALIVNPISGTGGGADRARQIERAAAFLLSRGIEPLVFVTERHGHARDLTANALRQGARTIVAWGGDGTVNEVASVLAFTDARLAIVPTGSGNGLARELRIPADPRAALEIAVGDVVRRVDVGELDGRRFVNIAGIGLDAAIAHGFAEIGSGRRGFLRYGQITLRELARYRPTSCRLQVHGTTLTVMPLMIAIANGRQYGNGAVIAAEAMLDDGQLDLVVVTHRPMLKALMQVPRLFTGQAGTLEGVTTHKACAFTVSSADAIVYHVDGEPGVGGTTIEGRVHAKALAVAVPAQPMPDGSQPTKR